MSLCFTEETPVLKSANGSVEPIVVIAETISTDNFSTHETTDSFMPYMLAGLTITLFCGLQLQFFSKKISKEKDKTFIHQSNK